MTLQLYFLTCANSKEAKVITSALLKRKLAVCIKQFPVSSSYRWKGKIKSSKEVLLLIDSSRDLFQNIESEIRKIHSYEAFALLSISVSQATEKILKWVRKELLVK